MKAESRKYSASRIQLLWADGWFLLDARFRVLRPLILDEDGLLVLSSDELMQVITETEAEIEAQTTTKVSSELKELGL